MTTDYDVVTHRFDPTDPRLGRHIRHDSRSLAYKVEPVADISQLKSVRHLSAIPVLDQGQLGSCTGNAATANLGTGVFWGLDAVQEVLSPVDADVDEDYAISVYSDATKLDPWEGEYPPVDTGSDGLSVAQVLKNRGIISGYRHCTSLDAVITALAEQPVIAGTVWRSNMYRPEPDGKIHISGTDEGGHEYLLDELDMENKRIWMRNSWTEEWGVDGRAYFTFTDFAALLADEGDVTVFVPITEPAPIPTPDPEPEPEPTPQPDPKSILEEIIRELNALLDKLTAWVKGQ